MALPAGISRAKKSLILLDNQSAVHIFHNLRLLKRLSWSRSPLHLSGIVEGQVLKTNRIGSFLDIAVSNVWYSTKSAANILSLHQLHADGFPTIYDEIEDSFTLSTPNDGVLVFDWDKDIEHYVCDFDRHVREQSEETVGRTYATVAENAKKYPERQIKAAKSARDLLQRAGFPSAGKLKELIASGNVINEATSIQDVDRSTDIFGPSVAALKGKMRKSQPTTIPLERPRSIVRGALVMHVDIVFMRAVPYLFAVTTPLGYLTVEVLTAQATPVALEDMEKFARSTQSVKKALFAMFNEYRARNYSIESLLTDNEGGMLKLADEIQHLGIAVNPNGPGQHVALIEHKAKILKERRRCHIHHVPFALPLVFELYLVKHCVFTINMMPTKTRGDNIAPAVDFFGRKLDSARDLRFVWGDLCQAFNPSNTVTNSDAARTDACVLLLSTGNLNGSVKMMNLASWTIVTRDQWKVIPYDQATIMQITAKAMADEVSLTAKQREAHRAKDAIFRRVHTEIVGNAGDDNIVNVPDENPIILHDLAPTGLDDLPVDISDDTQDQRGDTQSLCRQDSGGEDDPDDQNIGHFDDCHESLPREDLTPVAQETEISAVIQDTPPSVEPDPLPTNIPEPEENAMAIVEGVVEEESPVEESEAASESRYNLRHPKRYPTSSVFATVFANFHVHAMPKSLYSTQKMDTISHMSAAKALKHMRGPAVKAIVKELTALCAKEAWVAVHVASLTTGQRRKIIRSSMFLKEKYLANGEFEKLKARLVAGGHMQNRGDFGDISSPVVNATSVYCLAAIAAKERRTVVTVDIGSAFLNSDMSGDFVLMSLDPLLASILCEIDNSYKEYRNADGTVVVHLTKALYGCIRSSYLWYQTLSSFLIECGFKTNPYDPCVMNKMGGNGVQVTICFHVDDLLVTCTDSSILESVLNQLKTRFGEVTVHMGAIHNYLGAVFNFETPGEVNLSMPHHTKMIVADSGITGNAATPAQSTLFDIEEDSPLLGAEDKDWFHSFTHRVMYLANKLNFECLVACAFLSGRTQAPTEQDKRKLVHLLQYLNENPEKRLTLAIGDQLQVIQYTDASYGVHHDGKSHTGSCISLGRGAVWARSVKQKIVTKSSTESELVALSDESSKGLWCLYFLQNQGYSEVKYVTHMQDNTSAMVLALKGGASAHRTRHIKVRYFWINDYIQANELKLQHLATDLMIADGLTKPLIGQHFKLMCSRLLNG